MRSSMQRPVPLVSWPLGFRDESSELACRRHSPFFTGGFDLIGCKILDNCKQDFARRIDVAFFHALHAYLVNLYSKGDKLAFKRPAGRRQMDVNLFFFFRQLPARDVAEL